MPGDDDAEIVVVAREIERYLDAYPNAVDSLEGIAKWWLGRQRLQESSELVQKALEYLVDQGLIARTVNQCGETIYNHVSQNADDYH